jgi:threonine dehydrogenase-like Zn-dependent dehydrogenase
MRATVMYGAGDVRVDDVPDAHLIEPTDALVRVTRAAICGSDLWPYKSMPHDDAGRRMGHEFIGMVEAVGSDVQTVGRGDLVGDLVLSPFLWSDGTCVFCREGLPSECLRGGRYGWGDVDEGQGEAVRVPQADGTLVVLPVDEDDALLPSLLTLTDVMGTGHHAAVAARVAPGKTIAVVGDGAVGLCASSPRNVSPPSRSSCWAAMRSGLRSGTSSVRRTSSASAATRTTNECAN